MNHTDTAARMDASLGKPAGGQVCAMLAVDIAGFSREDRDSEVKLYLRRSLYQILEDAFQGSGLPWAECHREDRGDGFLVVMPPHVPGYSIIDPLPDRLRDLVRRHNRVSSESARMQLRAAANVGPVDRDDHGLVGDGIILLFRMLDARPFKRALADSGAELALIVSDYVHTNLVSRHPTLPSPEAFEPVRVRVKNTRTTAWTYLPEKANQDTRYGTDQAMTAFKAALTRMDTSPGEAARIRNLADATDTQIAAEAAGAATGTPTQPGDPTPPDPPMRLAAPGTWTRELTGDISRYDSEPTASAPNAAPGRFPDPLTADTAGEFVTALAALRLWAGHPSLREMARQSGYTASAATMYTAFQHKDKLPSLPLVLAIVQACGGDEEQKRAYATAWRKLKLRTAQEPRPLTG